MMAIKTEHAGAKHGDGFWGRKVEAKAVCKRKRRQVDRRVRDQLPAVRRDED